MPGVAGALAGAASMHLVAENKRNRASATGEGKEEPDAEKSSYASAGKMRARKLASMSSAEFSPEMLRSLFRLLDDDGSRRLAPGEVQEGLLLMGFDGARDPVALSRLLADIDEDRTGSVEEGEFLSYFVNTTRRDLATQLQRYTLRAVDITVTWWGVATAGKPAVRVEKVPAGSLREWWAALPSPRPGRMWVDVVGYDRGVFCALAECLGLPAEEGHDALSGCLLFQEANVDFLPVEQPEGSKVPVPHLPRMLVHSLELANPPLASLPPGCLDRSPRCLTRCISCLTGCEPQSSAHPALRGRSLVSKADITGSPPAVSVEQAALLVAAPDVLLTLRCPAFAPGEPSDQRLAEAARSGRVGDAPAVLTSPLVSADPSTIRRLYDQLRDELAASAPTVRHLLRSSTTVHGLCPVLVDALLQHNYSMRDALQDWEEALDADIRRSPALAHTPHLDNLARLTAAYQAAMQPLASALDPSAWADRVAEAAAEREADRVFDAQREHALSSAGFGSSERAPDPDSGRSAGPSGGGGDAAIEMATLRGSGAVGAAAGGGGGGAGSGSAADSSHPSLTAAFHGQVAEFSELAADVRSLLDGLDGKKNDHAELARLLASLKSDFMNRTLYALTLLTGAAIPLTFLTGIWGMNFADMPELDPETGGWGYQTFWIALGSVLTLVLVGMWRLGLFRALQ